MKAPYTPFAQTSSITVIDESTTAAQAEQWKNEIESRYNEFFGNPTWTWNEVHDCDRDILIELEEVVRSSKNPPMDMDLVSSFRTPDWRKAYSKNNNDFTGQTKIEILRRFGYDVSVCGHQFKAAIVEDPEAFSVVVDSEDEAIAEAYQFLQDEVDPEIGYIFPA